MPARITVSIKPMPGRLAARMDARLLLLHRSKQEAEASYRPARLVRPPRASQRASLDASRQPTGNAAAALGAIALKITRCMSRDKVGRIWRGGVSGAPAASLVDSGGTCAVTRK